MPLPTIPSDKANHYVYGTGIASSFNFDYDQIIFSKATIAAPSA